MRCRRGNALIDRLAGGKDRFARSLFGDYLGKGRLPQGKTQPRQEMQVCADRRADNRKERVYRLAVQGPEFDRLFEKAERDHGPQDVHDDRVADVRHGDAVAQRRRAQRLARQQHLEQELAVDLLGQRHDLDQRLEHGKLVGAAEAIVDAARLEGFGQARRPGRRCRARQRCRPRRSAVARSPIPAIPPD